jgi:hypothetical protein
MPDYGPNVTKLITQFIAREAVPPGGGLVSGLKFFQDKEYRKQVLVKAEADALIAIKAIQNAPDNSYGDDPEVIAGALLEKIEERKRTRFQNR